MIASVRRVCGQLGGEGRGGYIRLFQSFDEEVVAFAGFRVDLAADVLRVHARDLDAKRRRALHADLMSRQAVRVELGLGCLVCKGGVGFAALRHSPRIIIFYLNGFLELDHCRLPRGVRS